MIFNYVDVIFAIIMIAGLVGGIRRGFSGELALFSSVLLAGVIAWKTAGWSAGIMKSNTALDAQDAGAAGVLIVFGFCFAVLWGVRKLLRAVLDYKFQGRIESVGGACCGLLRGTMLAAVPLLLATLIPNAAIRADVTEHSYTGRLMFRHLKPHYEHLLGKPLPATEDNAGGARESDATLPEQLSPDSVTASKVLPDDLPALPAPESGK